MSDDVELRFDGPRNIDEVIKALRRMDASLPGELRKDLKTAARPLVAKAKMNAKTIPVRRPDRRRLRKTIAAGVGVQASLSNRAAVRIILKMPDSARAVIPRGLDSPRGFRHPLFGNRNKWYTQTSATPGYRWFMSAMQDAGPETRDRIVATLNEARDRVIQRGGS